MHSLMAAGSPASPEGFWDGAFILLFVVVPLTAAAVLVFLPWSAVRRYTALVVPVLGAIGVVSAFTLFYLAERVFHLDREHIQTLMYLKLSVAGHLTIFLTRTRGPFWSIKPARILWIAVLGTQLLATFIAVFGVFMHPIGWRWALAVWGYAIVWALFNDRLKLLTYRILDRRKKPVAPTQAPSHQAAS